MPLRTPEFVKFLDDRVLTAVDDQIQKGEYPKKKAKPQYRNQTGEFSDWIFYNEDKQCWILKRTAANGGKVLVLEAARLTDLGKLLLQAQGELTVENHEIERENQRIARGLPEGWDAETILAEKEEETLEFLNEYQEGADYSNMIDYLDMDDRRAAYRAIKSSIAGMGLTWTANNLAVAWTSLLNNNDDFYGLFEKARGNERAIADAQSQFEAQLAAKNSRLIPDEAPNPSVNANIIHRPTFRKI